MFMKKALFIAYIATIQTNILEEAIEVIHQSVHWQCCVTALVSWSTTCSQLAAKACSPVELIRQSWQPSWPVGTQQTVSWHSGDLLVFRKNSMLVLEICDESTISTITWVHVNFYYGNLISPCIIYTQNTTLTRPIFRCTMSLGMQLQWPKPITEYPATPGIMCLALQWQKVDYRLGFEPTKTSHILLSQEGYGCHF